MEMLACPYFQKLNKAMGGKFQEWDTDIVLREFRGQMNFTGIIRKDMCSRQKFNWALKGEGFRKWKNAKKMETIYFLLTFSSIIFLSSNIFIIQVVLL